MRVYKHLASTTTGPFDRTRLIEAKSVTLAQMFPPQMMMVPTIREAINNDIQWARTTLKKQDRVIWYLKRARIRLLHNYCQMLKAGQKTNDPLVSLYTKYSKGDMVALADVTGDGVGSSGWKTNVAHYLSLNLPQIESIVWTDKDAGQITSAMHDAEQNWIATRGREINMSDDHDAEKIMDLPDRFAWWNLNRSSCSKEASAMGHCGNSAADNGTVLSLRQQSLVNPNYWTPVATFILHDDGYLGEMKGRANRKPIEAYHKYIVPLLQHDMIAGIRGGGYAADQNFSIYDLPDEQHKELIAQKPGLKGPETFENQYQRLKDFSKLDFSELPSELQPYSDKLVHHRYQRGDNEYEDDFVLLDHIGDRDDLLGKMADAIPMVRTLMEMRDGAADLKKQIDNPFSERGSGEDIRNFWAALSEDSRQWIRDQLGIQPNRNEVYDVILAIQRKTNPSMDRYISRGLELLVQKYGKHVDLSPEAIDKRLDEYMEFDYMIMPDVHYGSIEKLSVGKKDPEYWVTMNVSHYLSAMDAYMEFQRDRDADLGDDYWILRVASNGWIGDDDSGDTSWMVDRLQEKDLIRQKPKPTDGPNVEYKRYWSEYDIDSYEDSKYGSGDVVNFFEDPHMLFVELAKEFDALVSGERRESGPQNDDQTKSMFDESLNELRRRAGII